MRGLFFYSIVILLSIQVNAFAQLEELEVRDVEPSSTRIPVFADYPDHAAIIVNSSLTDLRFDSNVEIVADLSDPSVGEYRIIIPPFRQSISVTTSGYKQLRFSVPVTAPRQVLFYEIEPLVVTEDLIPIVLSLNHLDAIVTIDNRSVDPNLAIRLEEGTYTIRIEKEGYRTIEEEIEIDEESFRFDYELEVIQLTTATYTSDPTDARLEINNVEVGQTNRQEFQFPGTYFVRVTKPGYKTIQQSVTVVENLSNDASLNQFHFRLEQSIGELNLSLNPPNSTVFLNNESYGSQSNIRVSPGAYLLEVKRNGYTGYSEPITINEGDVISRTVTLEQIVGTFRLTVQPINTRMRLINSDNEVFQEWEGATIINNIPIGDYRLMGNVDGYNNYTEQITIFRDQIHAVNVEMVERVAAPEPDNTPPPITNPIPDTSPNVQIVDEPENYYDDDEGFIQGYLGPENFDEPSYNTTTQRPSKAGKYTVSINLYPDDGVIFIDDNLIENNGYESPDSGEQGPFVIRLAAGVYTVRVEREGYRSVTEQMRVTDTNTEFYYSLNIE
jgi:hypothetical protein